MKQVTDTFSPAPYTRHKSWCHSWLRITCRLCILPVLLLAFWMLLPDRRYQVERAKRQATRASLEILQTALHSYKLRFSRYPTTQEGLTALLQIEPSTDQSAPPPPLKTIPWDAWSKSFFYSSPTPTTFALSSSGPDGIPNTQDDLQLPHD